MLTKAQMQLRHFITEKDKTRKDRDDEIKFKKLSTWWVLRLVKACAVKWTHTQQLLAAN